jgi:uncharacterized protein (DUF433 family)
MIYGAITIEQKTMDGIPVIRETHVPVHVLFEYLEEGKPLERFLEDHPDVSKTNAQEVLQMAKYIVTTERILQENFTSR